MHPTVVASKSGSDLAGGSAATRLPANSHLARGTVIWLLFGACLSAASPGAANELAQRAEAIRSIPFDKLDPPTQQRLSTVINNTSVYRRMPLQVIDSDPDMYLFLIRHPEVMVNIWELMGISNVTVRRTGPYAFDASDGMGTTAKVELIYGDKETHVMVADGDYEGPLFRRKLTGRCVMVLRSGYDQPQEGRTLVANRLDVFLQVDNAGVELLAKTLHPLMGKTADTNFIETTKFVSQVSGAAEKNGPGVEQLAGKLTKVDPDVRDRFTRVAGAVYDRAMLRMTKVPGPMHPQPIMDPTVSPLVEVRADGVYISDVVPESVESRPTLRPGPMLRR